MTNPAPLDPTTSDLRERILTAAEEVLRRYGPAKTSVVDVARHLSMSHGNIYRVFASKEALRGAVVERWLERVHAPLPAIAADSGPASDRLIAWFTTLARQKIEKVTSDPELFQTYQTLLHQVPEVIDRHLAWLAAQVRQLLAEGQAAGEFRFADLDQATGAVLAATVPFRHPDLIVATNDSPDHAKLRAVLALVIAGLKTGALA